MTDIIEKMIEAGAKGIHKDVQFGSFWDIDDAKQLAEACLRAAFKELPNAWYEVDLETNKKEYIIDFVELVEQLKEWAENDCL